MKICCIADTHMEESKVKIPKCDILIHAGDYDIRTLDHLEQLNDWFWYQKKKCRYIIAIAGNHDFYMAQLHKNSVKEILHNAIYLHNDLVEIEGLRIWGSPYSKIFGDWAFMLDANGLVENWRQMPDNLDILITHCPPYMVMDRTRRRVNVGCSFLETKILSSAPRYHIFGHIHECGGSTYKDSQTTYVNASVMNENYDVVNEPIVLEI